MLGAIVVKDDSLARGISKAGDAIGGALMERAREKRKTQGLSPFEKIMQQNSENGQPQMSIAEAYKTALQGGADPQTAMSLAQMYQHQQQQNAFKSGLDAALDIDGGIESDQGRMAFLKSYSQAGGDFRSIAKMLERPKPGQASAFDKKMDDFKAEAIIDLTKGGGKSKAVHDNLQWLEMNKDNVGRARGLMNLGPMQNELFAEYENRGNLVLSSVIDIYNKAGALPTAKLEWLKKQFAISPYDTHDQIQGKINALKPLVQQAVDFEAKLGDLVDRYGANIPNSEFLKLSKSLNNSIDKQYDQQFKRQVYDKPPNPSDMKGKIIENPQTGERMISNGSRWVKYGG